MTLKGAGRYFAFALAGVAVLYCAICALLYVTQRSLIYFPQHRSYRDGVTVLKLPSPAGPALVSSRPASGPVALIYFGGNAEDVSEDLPGFVDAFPGYAIYLLHYPGYGGSAGAPSESLIIADGLNLFDLVHSQHPNVVVIGRSLGTGVAVQVAARRPIGRLVLVTPYDSLGDIAAAQYSWLPARWLLRDRYDSGKYAPQISAPTKIVAAADDEVIPHASTDLLRTRFRNGVASYVVVPGVGHNTISDDQSYLRLLSTP